MRADVRHLAVAACDILLLQHDQTRDRQICRAWNAGFDRFVGVWRGARDQEGRASAHDFGRDRRHLLRRLAQAEHHLGEPLANRTVMVDLRKAQIFEGTLAERVEQLFLGIRGTHRACGDLIQ